MKRHISRKFDPKIIRKQLKIIIFGTRTTGGRLFDILLLLAILLSVAVVMLESIPQIGREYTEEFRMIEWVLTILFTIEYILRIIISDKKWQYVGSFMGIVDFLAVLPTYLIFFFPEIHFLAVIRIIRVIRVFKVLKLTQYVGAGNILISSLRHSRLKIAVFFITVLLIVTVIGTLMFIIEGPENGFYNIPISIYWTIVTITTVGYGDISPQTPLGQFLASIAMIIGYAIIAVPTGVVTAEVSRQHHEEENKKKKYEKIKLCPDCNRANDYQSNFCSRCGTDIAVSDVSDKE